jgi:hypothetical protein
MSRGSSLNVSIFKESYKILFFRLSFNFKPFTIYATYRFLHLIVKITLPIVKITLPIGHVEYNLRKVTWQPL